MTRRGIGSATQFVELPAQDAALPWRLGILECPGACRRRWDGSTATRIATTPSA
jgi:hypothetical protein